MATRVRYRPVSTTSIELINTQEDWYLFKVKKETTGQVVIGESQELLPVDSGRGVGIMDDEWTDMVLSPGTILFAAAPTEESIAIVEQIIPLRQIFEALYSLPQMVDLLKAMKAFGGNRPVAAATPAAPAIDPLALRRKCRI